MTLTEIREMCEKFKALPTLVDTDEYPAIERFIDDFDDMAREELPRLVGVLEVIVKALTDYCPKWKSDKLCRPTEKWTDCSFCPFRETAKAVREAGIWP